MIEIQRQNVDAMYEELPESKKKQIDKRDGSLSSGG
jgi:hypothetical protein